MAGGQCSRSAAASPVLFGPQPVTLLNVPSNLMDFFYETRGLGLLMLAAQGVRDRKKIFGAAVARVGARRTS